MIINRHWSLLTNQSINDSWWLVHWPFSNRHLADCNGDLTGDPGELFLGYQKHSWVRVRCWLRKTCMLLQLRRALTQDFVYRHVRTHKIEQIVSFVDLCLTHKQNHRNCCLWRLVPTGSHGLPPVPTRSPLNFTVSVAPNVGPSGALTPWGSHAQAERWALQILHLAEALRRYHS